MGYTIETEWSKKGVLLFLRQKIILSCMKYKFYNFEHKKYEKRAFFIEYHYYSSKIKIKLLGITPYMVRKGAPRL